MYYLMIEARPCADNAESREFGGAFVNCWINTDDERWAVTKAEEYIASEGWETVNIEEAYPTDGNDINDPEFRECYEIARSYGAGAVFNTWPLDEDM